MSTNDTVQFYKDIKTTIQTIRGEWCMATCIGDHLMVLERIEYLTKLLDDQIFALGAGNV